MNKCILVGKIIPNTLEKNDSYCNTAWDFTMYAYDKIEELPEVIYCRVIDEVADEIRKIISRDKYTWISAEGRIKDMDDINVFILIDNFKFIKYEEIKEEKVPTYHPKNKQLYDMDDGGHEPWMNPGIGWEL